MRIEDVKKLANLARIDMDEMEMNKVAEDFDAILAYVSQIQKLSGTEDKNNDYFLKNVMREDIVTNDSGEYRDDILKEMPETENGYLKVKQIL